MLALELLDRTSSPRRNLYRVLKAPWYLLGMVLLVELGAALNGVNLLQNPLGRGAWIIYLALAAYVLTWFVVGRLSSFAGKGTLSTVLANLTTIYAFFGLAVVVADIPDPRSYFLFAYVVTWLWLWLPLRAFGRYRPRLAVVKGGMAGEVVGLPDADWVLLEQPSWEQLVDGIVVDLHDLRDPTWVRFVAEASLRRLPVYHAAAIYEQTTGRLSLHHGSEQVWNAIRLPPLYPTFKRLMDIGLVLLSALLTLPLMLAVAAVVRLDSKGPVLFWQERMGRGGRPFPMVKFRTMSSDTQGQGPRFAGVRDQRITRVGHLLRKFRLDELPQLWNVLKGEMSLIGPRPEQVGFAEPFAQEIPLYSYRHLVRPGLTGWAQVSHGYAADSEQTIVKLSYDLYYVKCLSLWLDLLILFRTLVTILTGFGAR